jgi:gamma-glutamylcyclotransferase (GGCT)/AIG2-like uncharacterized protein YtfP
MDVFVYGTLTNRDTAASVLDSFEYCGAATLQGLHRVDGEYPTLLPGESISGRLLVTEDDDSLDSYEGVDRGLYIRVTIPRADGGAVETYIGNPTRLGVSETWPGTGTFSECVRTYLDEKDVRVRVDDSM